MGGDEIKAFLLTFREEGFDVLAHMLHARFAAAFFASLSMPWLAST